MEEKLRILEDLNMLYIRQIALSLQVQTLTVFTLSLTEPSTTRYWRSEKPVRDYTVM